MVSNRTEIQSSWTKIKTGSDHRGEGQARVNARIGITKGSGLSHVAGNDVRVRVASKVWSSDPGKNHRRSKERLMSGMLQGTNEASASGVC